MPATRPQRRLQDSLQEDEAVSAPFAGSTSPLLVALAAAPAAGLTVPALVAVVGGWGVAAFGELVALERAGLVRRAGGRGAATRWALRAAEGEA